MKQRSTTPVSLSFSARATAVACAVLMAIALPVQIGSTVHADQYDEQIKALQGQIDGYNANAAQLGQQADSYQAAVDRLNDQISTIQAQIELAQAKRDKYTAQIKDSEAQIASNKKVLGDTIASLYVDSDISPLEMVASSKNIGDYLDKQAQRQSVQDKLSSTVNKIEKLKKGLEEQKKGVEHEILNQKNARDLLANKQAEQKKLVDETRGQEDQYRQMAKAKDVQIANVRAEQAEANRRAAAAAAAAMGGSWSGGIPAGIPGGGGYPGVWANAPLDSYIDPWGLYTRECVSYAAWKVASTGRFVPNFGGYGNANQWPSTTAAYGIPHGTTPKVGSVAILNVGTYGHAMYVEAVNGDGTITVSDYNFSWDGLYRLHSWPASGLTYIYF